MRIPGRMAAMVAVVLAAACLPSAAAAAEIHGIVTAEDTHLGIGGVEVCPRPEPYEELECVETDSGGHYSFPGLSPKQYRMSFSAFRNNLPYVSEFFDDKTDYFDVDLITLGQDESRRLDVALARGGSIGGILTDEGTGQPIAGMRACSRGDTLVSERCDRSDAGGYYQVNGLSTGEYSVYYEGRNEVNYLREFYEDVETWPQATSVSVVAPWLAWGVDAELAPGAQILGHVSQVGSGVPFPHSHVCVMPQSFHGFQDCAITDESGDYALRGLPAGTYLVAFEPEHLPTGIWAEDWWQGAPTKEEATPIVIAPPETRTGIDGQVDRPIWGPPAPYVSPGVVRTTTPSTATAPKPRLRKCRRGFHRKLVKGKKRCVRKQRRHRPHQHQLGSGR
jgi:hypothetical protein